jgi:WD40 repeat protein
MMQHNDFFTSEHIDEQVEQVFQNTRDNGKKSSQHLLQALQQVYEQEAGREAQSLLRVQQRVLLEHRTVSQRELDAQRGEAQTYRGVFASRPVRERRRLVFFPHMRTTVAVVVACLLVGSIAVLPHILQFYYGISIVSNHSGVSASAGIATPTPITSDQGNGLFVTSYRQMGGVYALAWSPDGTRIASTSDVVQVWNPTTGKKLLWYTPSTTGSGNILGVAWSPDGTRIASTGADGTVQVWSATTGKVKLVLPASPQSYVTPVFSTAARMTKGSSTTQPSYSTGLVSRKALSGVESIDIVAWSPDGRYIASTSHMNGTQPRVYVWNAVTGALRTTYLGHKDTIQSLSWSRGSTYIASSSIDGTVQVWNAATGIERYSFNMSLYEYDAVWSPDGQRIASIGESGSIAVWDAFTGKNLVTYRSSNSNNGAKLAWSPDGKQIAVSTNTGPGIEFWNIQTGQISHIIIANSIRVCAIAWSPNGHYIASANTAVEPNAAGMVMIWRAS